MTAPDRRTFLLQTAGSLVGVALAPDLAATGPRRLAEPKSIGLVGLGRQGRAIIGELQKIEGASIKAVCDTSPARHASGLERAPGAAGFADHRALLDARRDLDAVIVATPTHLHRQVVTDVLDAGKHCYCEAPLAHTVEDARAIEAAALAATNRVFMAGFQARSHPV
jgi:predicted dehydrogenase